MWYDPKPLTPQRTGPSLSKRHSDKLHDAAVQKIVAAVEGSVNYDDLTAATGFSENHIRKLIRELMRGGVIERDTRHYFRRTK